MISPLSSIFFFRYQKFSGKQKVSFTKLFVSVLWDKKFRQNCDAPSPSYAWKFSMKEFFWNTKVFSNKIFRYSETKNFRRKIVIPLLCIKLFDTPNFLKHWSGAQQILRHCETKTFRRENVIPPIKHKVFWYSKISETLNGCPRNFSALWDKKLSTEGYATPIMQKIVRYPNFSETLKGCPPNFSALWDQNFPAGKRDTPVFIHKTFWNRNFSQKHWDSLTKIFGTVRQKFVDGTLWYPHLSINFFDTPIILKTWTEAHEIFFGTVRQKVFDGKLRYPYFA